MNIYHVYVDSLIMEHVILLLIHSHKQINFEEHCWSVKFPNYFNIQ